jgi:hypothetical protein
MTPGSVRAKALFEDPRNAESSVSRIVSEMPGGSVKLPAPSTDGRASGVLVPPISMEAPAMLADERSPAAGVHVKLTEPPARASVTPAMVVDSGDWAGVVSDAPSRRDGRAVRLTGIGLTT